MPRIQDRQSKPRQQLDAFLEKSGLEAAFQGITNSMSRRGVDVERRYSNWKPRFTFKIRRWLDGVECMFLVAAEVDKDGHILVKINRQENFTAETLPTGPELHQLLVEQAGKPIKKKLK